MELADFKSMEADATEAKLTDSDVKEVAKDGISTQDVIRYQDRIQIT